MTGKHMHHSQGVFGGRTLFIRTTKPEVPLTSGMVFITNDVA